MVDILTKQINLGKWSDWLPSERNLCEQLQVSRGTLRLALKKLRQDGIIRSESGHGSRIINRPPKALPRKRTGSIGVVLPDAIGKMPHNTALMVNNLRGLLTKEGYVLTLHESRQFFQRNGLHLPKKLLSNFRHDCWLLFFATPSVQQWFDVRGLRCLVIGSNHAHIKLPTISPDHFGMGRHAAGLLLAHGHRHIAHLHRGKKNAGDLQAMAGVQAALTAHTEDEARVTFLEFDNHVAAFVQKLLRLLRRPRPPTGLLISSSHYTISVLTAVLGQGYRIPRDLSLVCLADSPTIKKYTVPLLAHYCMLSRNHHLRVLRLIRQLISEGSVRKQHTLIFPEFLPGNSVAAPPLQ